MYFRVDYFLFITWIIKAEMQCINFIKYKKICFSQYNDFLILYIIDKTNLYDKIYKRV